jgi:hypothetical protein
MILRTGELWGRRARFGGPPRVKAHAGELREDATGFEFFTFAEPDLNTLPSPLWSARGDKSVWGDDETARLQVLVTKVAQDIE